MVNGRLNNEMLTPQDILNHMIGISQSHYLVQNLILLRKNISESGPDAVSKELTGCAKKSRGQKSIPWALQQVKMLKITYSEGH